MRFLIWVFLSGALLTTYACNTVSERSANRNANIGISTTSPRFQATARAIKSQQPEISDEILSRDEIVIYATSPEIIDYYQQREFSREQAEEVMLLSWQELRLRQPTASLDQQTFRASAQDWGFLDIKSTPSGASVMVGDKKLNDPTETGSLLRPGNYRVQLSKAGYQSVTDTCQISAGERTEFIRELPPKTP